MACSRVNLFPYLDYLAPRLKKEWSYTSTPPLSLRGLFEGELTSLPRLSSTKVKERVELYLYSPSEPSWPVLG